MDAPSSSKPIGFGGTSGVNLYGSFRCLGVPRLYACSRGWAFARKGRGPLEAGPYCLSPVSASRSSARVRLAAIHCSAVPAGHGAAVSAASGSCVDGPCLHKIRSAHIAPMSTLSYACTLHESDGAYTVLNCSALGKEAAAAVAVLSHKYQVSIYLRYLYQYSYTYGIRTKYTYTCGTGTIHVSTEYIWSL